jgi:serine/threonine-protein kinase
MSVASERNLLFAVLALQSGLVGKDALLSAMNAWGLVKHRLLGDILVENGALSPEDRRLLDGLIQRQVEKHGSAQKSLAATPASAWLKEQIKSVCPQALQESLDHLGAHADAYATASQQPEAEGSLRYRILRPHAKGGLGEVFVAQDLELHREVALKEIRAQHIGHDASHGRFVLEAEITGRLEHPGIVPVYGAGTHGDGRPFYAMRFIRGDNLKEAIARFHQASLPAAAEQTSTPAGPSPCSRAARRARFESLEFRQLVARFINVCNALAYAHSRGVLHRDLKPGNIMLGKFGETLVVDWGLAKVLGPEGASGSGDAGHNALLPSCSNKITETVAGSAVGTPAFMSPEQAAGKIEELGPATDIYSLGATLYTLLMNHPPIEGSDTGEILRKAQRGDIAWRKIDLQAVPIPLVAICKKAMAHNPHDRYATPLALADDLENWLGDEPVSVYRAPLAVRARRWARRHHGAVSAIAASVLVVIVGLLLGVLLLGQRNDELAATNRALATSNDRLAAANAELRGANAQLDGANRDLAIANARLNANPTLAVARADSEPREKAGPGF